MHLNQNDTPRDSAPPDSSPSVASPVILGHDDPFADGRISLPAMPTKGVSLSDLSEAAHVAPTTSPRVSHALNVLTAKAGMAYVALIGTISFLMKGGIYIFLSTPLGQAAPLIALAPMVCLVAWSVYRRGEESAALRYASFLEQEGPSASRVNRLLEPLCAAQKLSVPLVRFDTSSAEHTASIAHLLGKPFILVNERVLDQMSDRELRAILAHELGHRNPFLRGMGTLARHALSTIPPLVGGVTLCWTMGVVAPKLGTIMGFLSWGVSFPLLSYGLGLPLLLCSRYISRKEEIMTDIRSCAATGDPEAMISVLYKLKAKSGYVVHGVRGAALLRTHPTEDARIQKLREVFGVSEVKETSNNAAPRSA